MADVNTEQNLSNAGDRNGAGNQKKARTFDLDTMFAQAVANAPVPKSTENSAMFIPDSGRESMEDLTSRELNKVKVTDEAPKPSSSKVADEDSDDDCGPSLPPGFKPDQSVVVDPNDPKQQAHEDSDEDFEEPITVSTMIPAESEVSISSGSTKAVTALAMDNQGCKFCLGTQAYFVNLYDYQKMDKLLKPYRDIQPSECHVINGLSYSANGEKLVIASGEARLKVLDRNGQLWAETLKGDQYLVDVYKTKGHTASVNACCWHPHDKTQFLTCSDDGTLRVWSTEDWKELTKCINTQRAVIRCKNAQGKRVTPMCCTYSRDGKLVAAGCEDGSIQVWKHPGLYVHAQYLNRKAHQAGVTCITFSPDNKKLVSRSLDGTLKVWELAKFREPLLQSSGHDCSFAQTDCGYSPDCTFIYTGTQTLERDGYSGSLLFFSSETLELMYKINYSDAGCIKVMWHPKIDQILVGLTNGNAKNYYDPKYSQRGAKLCADKPIRRPRATEVVKEDMILSPLTLEMFQPKGEDGEEKELTEWRLKKYLRMEMNKQRPAFRTPASMPQDGHGAGGRVAAAGGTLHSYVAQQLGVNRNKEFIQDEDVRASILRHHDECEKNPMYITKAYQKTQPKPVFQSNNSDDEDDKPAYKVPKLG